MNEESESLAALAALSNISPPEEKSPKIINGTNYPATHKVKQFPIFSTGILLCYIQGEAPALFMQATLADYEKALNTNDDKIKEFLKPLFLLLHNNKNIKFRALNTTRLVPAVRDELENYILAFRTRSTLEGFLSTYKDFLSFASRTGVTIKKDKVFLNIEELALHIANYRDQAVLAEQTELFIGVSDDEIKSLTF